MYGPVSVSFTERLSPLAVVARTSSVSGCGVVPRSGSTTRTLTGLPGLIWSSLRVAASDVLRGAPWSSSSFARISFSSARFSSSSLERIAPLEANTSASVTTVIAGGSSTPPFDAAANDSANV